MTGNDEGHIGIEINTLTSLFLPILYLLRNGQLYDIEIANIARFYVASCLSRLVILGPHYLATDTALSVVL